MIWSGYTVTLFSFQIIIDMYQGFAENKPERGSFHDYSFSYILHQVILQGGKRNKTNVIITTVTYWSGRHIFLSLAWFGAKFG